MSTKRQKMDCIVVGGCANGTILNIFADASFIELLRPDGIKPIANSLQKRPEIIHESDQYEVHPISLQNTGEPTTNLIGLAVIRGKSLSWAFTELIKGYVKDVTNELLAAGVITKQ